MAAEKKSSRILVVDDDPGVLRLLETLLKANGYEVFVTDEAPAGLELAMRQQPDLIVLDVMMPIINGFNMCRLIKTQDAYKNIPIVLLTSRSTEDDRRIGMDVGADAYFAKPLKTGAFLQKIKELLKVF